MTDLTPKRFDQIIQKTSEESVQVLFSGGIVLAVGVARAAYTFPSSWDDGVFSWTWKCLLFFGVMGFMVWHAWQTARFALRKDYKAAGAFMVEAMTGPAVREMPFTALWGMREIAWAEHQDQRRAARTPGAAPGFVAITMVDASGEAILENTRVDCVGCGRALRPGLASDLWREREEGRKATRIGEDLGPARRCASCGGALGRFRTSLAGPVENKDR